MIKILIPENAGDLRVIEDAVQQCCDFEDGKIKKNTSMVGVFIKPNIPACAGDWARFVVVDNRSRQCYTEDFATLDGAMSYASDLHTTTEKQSEWDVQGRFFDELVDAVTRKTKSEQEKDAANLIVRDPLAYWIPAGVPHGGDHLALVDKFVSAIILNVNNHHTVRFTTRVDEVAVGELKSRYMVHIIYLNESEDRNDIDHALEAANGGDWHEVCDLFLKRSLAKRGQDPEKFDWPTPDVKVTFDYLEDSGDCVHSVVLEWEVDEATWRALGAVPDYRDRIPTAQGECPNCHKTVSLEWDTLHNGNKAFCPHCGSPMLKLKQEEHNDEQV